MASDIVERLKALSEEYRDHDPDVVSSAAKAAAEIGRIRAALAAWEEWGAVYEGKLAASDASLDAAKAEADRLREALRPFAHALDRYPKPPTLVCLSDDFTGARHNVLHICVFEAARAALQEKPHD